LILERVLLEESIEFCLATIERINGVLRTLQAAEIAGIRALVVHAKDDAAKGFYQRFDFVPSPSDPLHLFVLLKDLRQLSS